MKSYVILIISLLTSGCLSGGGYNLQMPTDQVKGDYTSYSFSTNNPRIIGGRTQSSASTYVPVIPAPRAYSATVPTYRSMNVNPLGRGYLQNTNPFARGYVQSTNPFARGYVQNNNPFARGYVQSTNPFARGYVQSKNPLGRGYIQNPQVLNGILNKPLLRLY